MVKKWKKALASFLAVAMSLSPVGGMNLLTVWAEDAGNESGSSIKNFTIPAKKGVSINWDGDGEEIQYFKAVTEGTDASYFVTSDASNYNVSYDPVKRILTLNSLNCVFEENIGTDEESGEKWLNGNLIQTEPESWDTEPVPLGEAVTLRIIGENQITARSGVVLNCMSDLTVEGSGSLTMVTEAEAEHIMEDREIVNSTYIDEDGNEVVVRPAPFRFSGENLTVSDGVEITVSAAPSKGEDGEETDEPGFYADSENLTMKMENGSTIKGLIDAGPVYGRGYNFIAPDTSLPEPEPPAGYHVKEGKAYYFYPDEQMPNTHFEKLEEGSWRYYGMYADGRPVPSKVRYQYLYENSAGMQLTDDRVEKTAVLVYDEDIINGGLSNQDVAAIEDGEQHTFGDLYSLWLSSGDVTVNGDITLDLACFAGVYWDIEIAEEDMPVKASGKEQDGEETKYIPYRTDGAPGSKSNPEYDTSAANVTVNGTVGLISLNQSYQGNVTVNGDVNMLAYYKDLDGDFWVQKGEDDEYGYEQPEEHYYGAKANAGQVVSAGSFTDTSLREVTDDYDGYCVYDDTLYIRTSRELTDDGETGQVKGTTAAVEEDSLLIEVSADESAGIDGDTYPCIRKPSESEVEAVKAQLTNTDTKLSVMDISLVRQSEELAAAEVEPEKEVSLYLEGLEGFTKPALFHVKADGTMEKLAVYEGTGSFGVESRLKAETGSFSTYFIAEDQTLKQDLPAPAPQTPSSSGSVSGGGSSTAGTAADNQNLSDTNTGNTTETGTNSTETARPETGATVTDEQTNASYVVIAAGEAATAEEPAKVGEVAYEKPEDTSAESVTIPATVVLEGVTYKVTTIAEDAFKNNDSVTKVKIPIGVKTIGKSAFEGASALKTVTVPNTVISIGNDAFKNCTELKKAVIGKGVKAIPVSAFEGCTSLTSVIFKGDKVTVIRNKAFKNCTKLTRITLSEDVKTIGAQAFANCKNLIKLVIPGSEMKKINQNAFTGVPKTCKTIVPAAKSRVYKKLMIQAGYKGQVTGK